MAAANRRIALRLSDDGGSIRVEVRCAATFPDVTISAGEVKPIERAATAPTSSTDRMSNRPWPWLRPRVDRHVAPVPAAQLSRTIDFARIALIVGLVFLHYGMYPNFRLSPFGGMSVNEYEVATFVNSFLLFFFLSVVPLLSMKIGRASC